MILIAELPVALMAAAVPKISAGALTVRPAPDAIVKVLLLSMRTAAPVFSAFRLTLPPMPASSVWLAANNRLFAAALLAVIAKVPPVPLTEKIPLPFPPIVSPELLDMFSEPAAITVPLLFNEVPPFTFIVIE